MPPWGETKVVGKPLPRVDAYERVSGSAVYPLDVALPDMLHAAILRCPHAHAQVKSVDTSAAEKMPGVRAVLTGRSPGADIPWYRSRGKSYSKLFDDRARHEGDEVAAVAAETRAQAYDALKAIRVEYEVLAFVLDPREALKPEAPPIHDGGNRYGDPSEYRRGDVEAGWAAADAVVEGTYSTACEIHAPMEVHGSVAKWDGNRLTVWDSTQGVFVVQQQVAQALKLPLASVRVLGHYMGGGFGSKLEAGKYTVIAALLAKATARPVKLFLSREETFVNAGNRPANTMKVKIGAKRDGTLTAIEFLSIGSGGAYPNGADTSFLAGDLYTCPNVRTLDENVAINAGRARAMRAPGFPQGAWALEQAMDALADKLGMDPVALRLANVPKVSQKRGNQPYTSTGLAECLAEGAKQFGWSEARKRPKGDGPIRKGYGVASGMWGYGGGPPATVVVKLFSDGSVNVNTGAADIGTGTKTVMSQVVAEELGVPLEKIQIEHADTGTTQYSGPSGGSKTVPSDMPAARAAAIEVRTKLLKGAADEMKLAVEELALAGGEVVSTKDPAKKLAVTAVPLLQRQQVLVGVGTRGPNVEGKVISMFATHFAEVEVNTRTGEVTVTRLLAAQDCARVVNRLTFECQVQGGLVMGLGLGRTEERVLDRQTGKMCNANWHDYKIPTALDVPAEQKVHSVDLVDTECNTVGAKGVGEPSTIPTAAAIANAVHDAVGVRVPDSPITPPRLMALLAARGKKG
ncbi:MAG: xanthine dehydrogenase family protein molybdopterin-binding subunit [Holophagales bacterium]|nr:xanthine dehydrogenase family protein molybdopterin-binding subunit [Holophagales bacterium]